VKSAQWDKTQSRELLGLFICVCIALCTIVAHNIAQKRPDNFPSCPPYNHHCCDDVYLREGGRGDCQCSMRRCTWQSEIMSVTLHAYFFAILTRPVWLLCTICHSTSHLLITVDSLQDITAVLPSPYIPYTVVLSGGPARLKLCGPSSLWTHTTTTILRPFFRDHLGEPVPEENFWNLWCMERLTEADTLTIRLGATPSRLTSAHLHHPVIFFYGPDVLPAAQPTASKHWSLWTYNDRITTQFETDSFLGHSPNTSHRYCLSNATDLSPVCSHCWQQSTQAWTKTNRCIHQTAVNKRIRLDRPTLWILNSKGNDSRRKAVN